MAKGTRNTNEGQGEGPPSSSGQGGALAGAFVLLLLLVLAAGLVWVAFAPKFMPPKDAGFIDGIFANRPVMAASRIVLLSVGVMLLFAAVYIITSIVVRMARGEWLQRFGPFEVAEASHELQTAREEIDRLRELAAEDRTSDALEPDFERMADELLDLLDEKDRQLAQAQEEIVRLGGERPSGVE